MKKDIQILPGSPNCSHLGLVGNHFSWSFSGNRIILRSKYETTMKRLGLFALIALSLPLKAQTSGMDFADILAKCGYDPATVGNLTDSSKIKLDEPRCAYVNITGIGEMPTTKTQNLQAWLEFYDGDGNYFIMRHSGTISSLMQKNTQPISRRGRTESDQRGLT